ncbi:MAG: rhodanese-like domain-containing protein [Clostridiales bacterium]|nr:rhodanese-like domain-containing protein [Clostridiales bacterium]
MKRFKILPLLLILVMIVSVGCAASQPVEETQVVIEKTEEPAVTETPDASAIESAATAYLVNMPADNNMIGAADLFAKMDAGEEMFILDVRKPDVYEQGHLKGAVNLPYGANFSEGILKLPADQPIYVYCYTGQTANQVNATLNILGYDVKSIKYGWVLGISKTEGFEAYTEVESNDFATYETLNFNPEVMTAVEKYFSDLATAEIPNNIISSEAASQLLNDDNYYFLSIRQQADYDAGHIPGANNIPWSTNMTESFSTLPMDKKIIVNCYSGQTAGQTITVLRLLGYDAVSIKSGMGTSVTAPSGWANKGFETVTTISEAAAAVMNNKPDDSYMLGAADAFLMIENQDDMFILDIRQNDVYSQGHLKGAVNVPWGPEFAASIEKLPADKPVLVYCYSGQTAGQTVGVLNALGYDAKSIKYGWNYGISVTEGYEAYTEVESNDFGNLNTKVLSEHMKQAATNYFMGLTDVADTIYKNYKISEEEAYNAAMAADGSTTFVDVRNNVDYVAGHIPGAINIPYGTSMVQGFADLPKDQKIIVNCYSGQTAGQTVAIMRLMGYDAVSVNGGMGTPANSPIGYISQGYEIVQ